MLPIPPVGPDGVEGKGLARFRMFKDIRTAPEGGTYLNPVLGRKLYPTQIFNYPAAVSTFLGKLRPGFFAVGTLLSASQMNKGGEILFCGKELKFFLDLFR